MTLLVEASLAERSGTLSISGSHSQQVPSFRRCTIPTSKITAAILAIIVCRRSRVYPESPVLLRHIDYPKAVANVTECKNGKADGIETHDFMVSV